MSASTSQLVPADTQELIEIVQSAQATGTALQVLGGGTKQTVGFPRRITNTISMRNFDRLIDYDPAELVMTVGAGVSLSTVQELLATNRQMLAFEPFDFGDALGVSASTSTIGGIVGAGFAGSRRLSAGNVRDHMLGFTAVSGRGERFVAGGRVVKNVTGYDLSKLMCGSWGQLAVLTEITLKVLPWPRATLTLVVRELDDAGAFAAMTQGVRSQCEVAAAAYLPRQFEQPSVTLLRLEGFGPSVQARAATLNDLLVRVASNQLIEQVSGDASFELWRSILTRLVSVEGESTSVLWRISVPSTNGVRVCEGLRGLGARLYVDRAGALIWARTTANIDAAQVRALAERAGGHATLLDAPVEYRSRVCAQHPESPVVAALARRVKAAFDPANILDPQCFVTPDA